MAVSSVQSLSADLLRRGGRMRRQVDEVAGPVLRGAAQVWRQRVRPVVSTFTSVGGAVLAIAIVGWVLAWRFGWIELAVIATSCVVLLVVATLFLIGATRLRVAIVVEPLRVTAGDALTGEMTVENTARTPLVGARMEVPVGEGGVAFDVPPLLPGHHHAELFVVPTQRRGVIAVGPVTSVRGDPLGLFRRELAWTETTEVFVHPRITPLEPLGAGLIRDLEGNSSQNVSLSDLSFHALREYVPGDDLRHIHWRSSARHNRLLVRQFLDTRRSHLTAVVDSNLDSYGSEDEYETAISVAASLMMRALRDGYDVSFLSGRTRMSKQTGRPALDVCARAVPEAASLIDVAARGAQLAPDTSLVVIVTGPGPEFGRLQRASSQFGVEVGKVAVRVDASAAGSLRTGRDLPVLTLGALDQLGGLLRWGLG